jgi:Anti-sigma factor NepR
LTKFARGSHSRGAAAGRSLMLALFISVQRFCASLACNDFAQLRGNERRQRAVQLKNVFDGPGAAHRGKVPAINGLQTNEVAKLRREILMRVGNGLGIYYGDVLKEAIPDQFTELLRRLVATTEAERGED